MSITDFIKGFKERVYYNRFYLLFAALVLNLIIPEIKEFPLLLVIFQILTTMAGANLIDEKRPLLRKIWFALSILMLVCIILEYREPDLISEKIIYSFFFCFYFMITVNLFMQISKLKVISADVIIGAFCGYMLIGLMGFFIYFIIEKFTPGSFSNLPETNKAESLFYFSYISLTSTGFGDILPLTVYARKITVLFTMTGQFYMGVVIAILISKYLQNPLKKQN